MEKTRKQLTEKNAEYISTKAAQNREEIERVKESAKKDIDRANANVIAKEEECEKLECEIVELKRGEASPGGVRGAAREFAQTITRDFCKRKRRRQ